MLFALVTFGGGSLRSKLSALSASSRPDQIDGNAGQHDQVAFARGPGLQVDEVSDQEDGQADVDENRQRVGDRSDRAGASRGL